MEKFFNLFAESEEIMVALLVGRQSPAEGDEMVKRVVLRALADGRLSPADLPAVLRGEINQ